MSKEWCPICGLSYWPTSPHYCDGGATRRLGEAEARAEAAERRKTDLENVLEKTTYRAERAERHLAAAKARIQQLEELMPDADDLDETVSDAAEVRAILGNPDEFPYIVKMRKLVVAIREYQEAGG
jgi:DNA repair exonuclease SbcCD ATPase subunit